MFSEIVSAYRTTKKTFFFLRANTTAATAIKKIPFGKALMPIASKNILGFYWIKSAIHGDEKALFVCFWSSIVIQSFSSTSRRC